MASYLSIVLIILLVIAIDDSVGEPSRKELRRQNKNQDKIIQLPQQRQPSSIDPSKVIQLSWRPRVFLYRDFLSEQECDHLISLESNIVLDDSISRAEPVNFDISADIQDDISRGIEERISSWTFLPKDYGKPLKVLRRGSEDSIQNYNYFDNNGAPLLGEALLATVILYLSNVSEGGRILFPESENKMWSNCTKSSDILRPTKGYAVVFFNLNLNATPDKSSSHARCPVLKDQMWYATKFFYLKTSSRAKSVPESNETDCVDEDEDCPRWATTGECQRNSVFMVGSPDYYGTCRKSCNAC